ncbi:MAG TPA: 4-hydroxy-tetrahydrodipicolinate reductase [Longimicrobiales bacterium]|nr:4-hydroxy-tetrahydrodipicolinate reductase [Longimicrobiales bacterium]
MALDLVVSGATGRMGRALGRLIGEAEDLRALGGIAPDMPPEGAAALGYPEIVAADACGEMLRRADAVIDFSAPEQLAAILDRYGDDLAGKALLVGTTGLGDDLERRLDTLAGRAAVLVAANFSVGVNLLLELVERAARALPGEEYDIEVVEAHHRRKADAPSGTALALAKAAAAGRGVALDDVRTDGRSGRTGERPAGEIGIHALRGGDVVGEHAVHFLGARERIAIRHAASSRDLFAEGALVAARWLAGREPGKYAMADVLGLH